MSFRKRSISLGRRLVKGMPEGKTFNPNSLDSNETSTSSLKRPVSRNEIKTTNFNEELSIF